MKLNEIDTKKFKFEYLKKFLTRVAGGSKKVNARRRKMDKAEELGIDLSKSGKVPPNELRVIAKDELQKIYDTFGVDEREVFSIFKGESSFNTRAFNASGAVGLFQAMPSVASELGTSSVKIHEMSAAEQVDLYYQYLSMWSKRNKTKKFKGKLGVLQAAPGYAKKDLKEPLPGYEKGSKRWEQNPGWQPSDGGDITIASISDYYKRKA